MAKSRHGKRLIPQIIDEYARTEPNREFVAAPRSSNAKDGWKPITFKQTANAVNRIAHQLVRDFGTPEPGSFPTITYIGLNDVRYFIMMIACVKAGYKALFISPRNSREGQMNLFKQTDCGIICYDRSYEDVVQAFLADRPMRSVVVGSADEWLDEDDVAPDFPYTKTFDEAKLDPVVVLHTSGSTGLPKPIAAPVALFAAADGFHNLPPFMGSVTCIESLATGSKRLFLPMPLFHGAGSYMGSFVAIYWGHPIALGFPERPLTPQVVLDAVEYGGVDNALLPPSLLEEMAYIPECVDALRKMVRLHFSGGNLAREAGNKLVREGVVVASIIASTEAAPLPYYFQPNPELWQWFIVDSETMGAEWRHYGGEGGDDDDIYEQYIVRKPQEDLLQSIFYTFPDINEWCTKDLYRKHPTLPNHWTYHGRSDNIIVFSNGEKLNPVTIEELVTGHPRVKGAVVAGTTRFQPLLILEPTEDLATEEEVNKFINDVWPSVVRANKETVAHGQIGRQYVAVTTPGKPFPRAGKGTIQRPLALKAYEKEIDEWYKRAEEGSDGGGDGEDHVKIDLSSQEALTDCIVRLFQQDLGSRPLSADSDFFSSAGVDSMQVINASRILRRGLHAAGVQVSADAIATRVIYANPTPRQLAAYLMSVVNKGKKTNGVNGVNGAAHHENGHEENGAAVNFDVQAMEAQLLKYTRDLPVKKQQRQGGSAKPPPADEGQTILITGTTGGLGSYMLDLMEKNPAVKKIVCLNRGDDGGAARQAKMSAERGLAAGAWTKAEFLRADLSQPELGLEHAVYERLLREADRVIHNSWPVNFNMSVETFEPHVRGVRHWVDFSLRASKDVPVVFISSIGTVDTWTSPDPVPERKLTDLTLPGTGYGRAKLVGELILDEAARRSGVPTAVVRVGQIAGPSSESGVWNRQEWLPTIIASSVYLGVLPADLGCYTTVNWTPIEGVASLVMEVSGTAAPVPLADVGGHFFHGVNPRTVPWSSLVGAVADFYGDRITRKEPVPFSEWVRLLEESAAGTAAREEVDRNPGVKLIDFYRSLLESPTGGVEFSMEKTVGHSRTMREMGPVTPELMRNWCRQWGF